MKIQTWLVALVATVLGLIGATATYQQLTLSSDGPGQTQTDSATTTAAEPVARRAAPVVKVRYRKCPRGFQLRHKTCVHEVQRTVVVDVPAPAQAAAPAPAAAAPAPAAPEVESHGPRHGSDGDNRHPGGGDEGDQATAAHHDDGEDSAGEDHSDDGEDHADEDTSHEDEPEDD